MSLDSTNKVRLEVFLEKNANLLKDIGRGVVDFVDNPITGRSAGSIGNSFNPIEGTKRLLLGRKAESGPFMGRRLHPVQGPLHERGRLVSPEVGKKILKGKIPGEVSVAKVDGKKIYYARKFRPGGLAGVVMRNPGKSGLAALAAYLLLKPENRQIAGGMASGLAPQVPKGPTADVAKEWTQNQQSARPVLQQQAWG